MNLKIFTVELFKKSFNYDQTGKRKRIIRGFVKKSTLFHEYSILFIKIKSIQSDVFKRMLYIKSS
ncbi:hypothetical protein D0396_04370 [Staphylococcus epidermidis]|uniref:hypothetical protein n=1 Tax=Staphylococcus epidermidis TaxID=1282 RepID=UPI0001F48F33|nr:hypothetical protein [Staphylococcus epidermidis]EFV88634.1 hypothetical protein GSEF_1391 [Staphylococcus epidermidis FRI909]ATQ60615.1 hypothetical protein CPZ21_11045 [Staphylococcus epidermidis]MBF2290908.1 hypothetical protein [Staphylococcus epidermidis]MBM0771007.1 hypothetical protein [Staphylococcus epidermidis]MBM0828629.1 hypothetical protein [Staphylococcus epidermidis]